MPFPQRRNLLTAAGDLAAKYRKIHLFDVCVPGVVDFQESALISSGNQVKLLPPSLVSLLPASFSCIC
jgi:predicted amidohydrolase